MTTREVPCPRCHEPCGWCSDYRHMHGQLRLPGSKRRCGVPGYEPEGDACPVCHGSMRVLRTVSYTSLPKSSGAPPLGLEAGLPTVPLTSSERD